MNSCLYDRVFLVPAARESRGRQGRRGPYNPEPTARGSKISIAWWLIPSVVAYLAVSVLVLG